MGASGAGGALSLTDGDKLSFQSTGKVTIKAQDAIHICAKKVDMSALTQIRLMVAGSEINLNNLHDHGADGKVWYIGTTSQVLEPVTQPRKTNTPRGPDFSDLMPHVLGTIKQFIHGLANSAQENLSLGLSHPNEPKEWTLGYKAGRVTGDALAVIAGASEFAAGTGLEAGGMVASIGSGGTLAAVGVPVSAGGLALTTAGTAVAAKSATSFMADASHTSQNGNDKAEINLCSGKNKVATGTDYDAYRKKGERYPKYTIVKHKGKFEVKEKPNTSADLLNPDGSVKRRRYYDSRGRVLEDIDYNHTDDGTHLFPHRHKWEWKDGKPHRLPPNEKKK